MQPGAVSAEWREYDGAWQTVEGEVIEEVSLCLQVNGAPWFGMMCSPLMQRELAVGFLFNEGIINDRSVVAEVTLNQKESCAEVWLNFNIDRPQAVSRTTGCGGGLTLAEEEGLLQPIESEVQLDPEVLFQNFKKLQLPNGLYSRARGVHAAGLARGDEMLVTVEDVGRHNALDKIAGYCLLNDIPTKDSILYSTGRISSEMLKKAVRMGCPIVASRTSPTSHSLAGAKKWGLTLVGYARLGSMRVYSHPERLGSSQ
jgi:FdhD protein